MFFPFVDCGNDNSLKNYILANVIHVDYQLKRPFFKKDTRLMPFRTSENLTIFVETMYQFCETFVCLRKDFTCLRLPCNVRYTSILHVTVFFYISISRFINTVDTR